MLFKSIDTWLSLAFLASSIAIYYTASGYDELPSRFPMLLAVTMALLSVLLFCINLVKLRAKPTPKAAEPVLRYVMPALLTLGMIAYAAALNLAGFLIPSVIFMFYVGWILGYRRLGVLLLVSIGFVLVVYGIFGLLLGVPLPHPPFME